MDNNELHNREKSRAEDGLMWSVVTRTVAITLGSVFALVVSSGIVSLAIGTDTAWFISVLIVALYIVLLFCASLWLLIAGKTAKAIGGFLSLLLILLIGLGTCVAIVIP